MKKKLLIVLMLASLALTACSGRGQAVPGSDAPLTPERASGEEAEVTDKANELDTAIEEAEDAARLEEETKEEERSPGTPALRKYTFFDSMTNSTENTGDDYICYANFSIETLEVKSDGFDNLKEALMEEFKERKAGTKWFRDSVTESLGYEYDNIEDARYPWPYEDAIEVVRADDKVVSFISNAYLYMGGAHGGTTLKGCNFDTKTGAVLRLKDVVNDFDAFYEAVMKKLEERQEYFFEEWRDNAHRDIYEGDAENGVFAWALGNDSIRLVFGDYELGPYATGHVNIEISEKDLPDLIKAEYRRNDAPVIRRIDYEPYALDIYGDGNMANVWVEDDPHFTGAGGDYTYPEYVTANVVVEIDGERYSSEDIEDMDFSQAYLMESSDGGYFVCVEMSSYNDWNALNIFDINNPEEGIRSIGMCEAGSFYSYPPTDPDNLYLVSRSDVLGTYNVYRKCHLTGEGEIEPYETESYIDYYDSYYDEDDDINFDPAITAKADIEAYTAPDKSEKVTIDAGTKLTPIRTDCETYMVYETDDKKEVCVFYDEHGEDDWSRRINGVDENELFDEIMYAG